MKKTTGTNRTPSRSPLPARVRRGSFVPLPASSVAHRGSRSRTTVPTMTPMPLAEATSVRPVERSLAAVVVRSSMIAMITMARPATDAAPTLRICSAETTGLPRPGPLTSAAMVAIDSAAIVHWLTPTMIVRRAIGSCTWRSICDRVSPIDRAASTVVGGHRLDAVLGDPDQRRQRVDEREHHRGGRPDAEEQRERREVAERRHGLHQVEDRRDRCGHASAARHPDPERQPDQEADADGHAGDDQRVHAVRPQARGRRTSSMRQRDQDRGPQAGERVGDPRGQRDHAEPADLRDRPREARGSRSAPGRTAPAALRKSPIPPSTPPKNQLSWPSSWTQSRASLNYRCEAGGVLERRAPWCSCP